MDSSLKAIVQNALSGSSLVLRGRPGADGSAPLQRTIYLQYLAAPRMGNINQGRADEAFAFESRDALRKLCVGKEVSFSVKDTIQPSGTSNTLEFGEVFVNGLDLAKAVVEAGWAKVKESKDESERKSELLAMEAQARDAGKGLWASGAQSIETIYSAPADMQSFVQSHKGKEVDALVESVSNGSLLRVRLMLEPTQHQIVTLQMAGVRSPRAPSNTSADDSSAEACGAEAKFFSESRLLQRNIQVEILGLPPSSLSAQQSSPPLVGVVKHPAGSISALLTSFGFARCVDLHAAILGADRMSALRKAEADAKAGRKGLWRHVAAPTAASGTAVAAKAKGAYEAVVSRVFSADTIFVRPGKDGSGAEKRISFSSVRQPRPNDPKVGGLQLEAKEALRKRCIGKVVQVKLDYVQPASGDFPQKECCTVKSAQGKNLAEELVERGYLNVVKHRADDDNKSSDIDKLVQAEAKAQSEAKGLHSGKDFAMPRISDVSESATRANSFLASFKRSGKMPAVVDFVASGSRFKILLPKQDVKITLVLAGVNAPRTARNASERSEPFGAEALDFISRKAFQRDAEVEVDSTDRSGGFIGALYVNKENIATALVREGLAKVSEYLDRVSFASELQSAQEAAQNERKNIWASYEPEQEGPSNGASEPEVPAAFVVASLPPAEVLTIKNSARQYVDVLVSDVKTDPFSFSVQLLRNGGIPELEQLMRDFSLHHKDSNAAQPVVPRSGDLVSARFSADNAWYRARVLRSNPAKKQAEVLFMDYGNQEIVGFERLRPLDASFRKLAPQAKLSTLTLVRMLGKGSDYGAEAEDRFRELCEGKTLVANIDWKEPGANGLHHLTLYDPQNAQDASASINGTLVSEGLAAVDRRSKLAAANPSIMAGLQAAADQAHRSRAGMYEFGDVSED